MPDSLTRLSVPRCVFAAALSAALAVTGTAVGLVTAAPAAATGTDTARGAATGTEETGLRERVAGLDGAIARTEADLAAADARAATATEDYGAARVAASAAQRSAVVATVSAEAAQDALADAQADLALVVSQAYRQSGESSLLLALTAPGGGDILDRAGTVERLASQRDAAVQRVTAAAAVSDSRADHASAVAGQAEVALGLVSAAADIARREQELVDERAAALLRERTDLLAQLADLQATSIAAEQERQAELAAERARAADAAFGPGQQDAATGTVVPIAPEPRGRTSAPPVAAPAPPPSTPGAPTAAPTPGPAPTASAPTSAPAPTAAPRATPAPPAPAPSAAPPTSVAPPAPPATRSPAPPAAGPAGSASGGSSAVTWARTQLGKAYLWGGEGPDAYDCSGLVMRAWGQGGVSMPHSSRSQYTKSTKIDPSQLRPGDLIFYASDTSDPSTIHHVAIYSGNGMVIEAPNSRSVVREVPVRWSGTMPMAGRP